MFLSSSFCFVPPGEVVLVAHPSPQPGTFGAGKAGLLLLGHQARSSSVQRMPMATCLILRKASTYHAALVVVSLSHPIE